MGMLTIKLNRMFFSRSMDREKKYPLILAMVTFFICLFFELDILIPLLLVASINFSAITVGFVGTSLSILIALRSEVMDKIRRSQPHIKTLRGYIGWGLFSGGLFLAVNMVGLLLHSYLKLHSTDLPEIYSPRLYTPFWGGALVFCISCLWRLVQMMLLLFSDPENTVP